MALINVTVAGKTYPFPDEPTLGELRTVKQITGFGWIKTVEALAEGDPDAVIALAVVAMQRAGEKVTPERLEKFAVGADVSVDFNDESENDPGEVEASKAGE